MYFKMYILLEIIRQMIKITKCPIFLDDISLLVASKAHFFMYFKIYIIVEIIRQMTKITKCPIFLDAMNLLIASKSHFLMVL